MAEFVVIRIASDRGQEAEWIVVDDNGTRRSPPAAGSLAEAAASVRNRPVIVLLPATEILTTTVDLPVRGGARLNAALPYALEEQVAADVDDMHFAAGDKHDSGIRPVAAVARATMDGWVDQLEAAGIQPWKLVPENYGVARVPGTMSVLVDGSRVMFNDGEDVEFVLEGATPSDALVAAGQLNDRQDDDVPEQSGHLVVWCSPEDEERLSHEWITLRHELSSVDINLLPDGALARLAVTVASGQGVNLLQGRYGPKADYGSWLRPWSAAASLLIGLGLIGFAAKGVDYYRLAQEQAVLKTQFTQELRQIRPVDNREVLDPVGIVTSLKRGLGTTTAPQVFLPSLRELSSAIAQNSNASIEAISYRAGVIDVRLSSPDVETVGNIQKAISASGAFNATIQSTDKVADRINSRIQIREAGS
ncbi:MAG: type II secretion system protein GspL [Woeseiaceae bacterium]|nr:type II secretion system protein GspL [Woeseiaceae bacterium]